MATEFKFDATHDYVALAPCGCTTGKARDDSGGKASTAQMVANWIRRGDNVVRVTLEQSRDAGWVTCPQHSKGSK